MDIFLKENLDDNKAYNYASEMLFFLWLHLYEAGLKDFILISSLFSAGLLVYPVFFRICHT